MLFKLIFLIIPAFLISACSTSGSKSARSQGIKASKLSMIQFHFALEDKSEERYAYRSNTNKKTFEGEQLVNEKIEIVDFLLRSRTTAVNPKNKIYQYELSTLQKDGFVNLRDLAFPEVGEKILYTVNGKGEILSAGTYPNDSEYAIPFFFPPKDVVEVGDTWADEVDYILSESGIPLKLELTSILKRLLDCGLNTCGEIELSGKVSMLGVYGETKYESEFSGRMLVRAADSKIIWQEIRTGESLNKGNTNLLVFACIESKMTLPNHIAVMKNVVLDCEPKLEGSLFVESPFKNIK